jgi:hypothetical protein
VLIPKKMMTPARKALRNLIVPSLFVVLFLEERNKPVAYGQVACDTDSSAHVFIVMPKFPF